MQKFVKEREEVKKSIAMKDVLARVKNLEKELAKFKTKVEKGG